VYVARTAKLPVTLDRTLGRSGAAGSFTITLASEAPIAAYARTVEVPVQVPPLGVDVVAIAEDVFLADAEGNPTTTPVPPGGIGVLLVAFANVGDVAGRGYRVSATLPAQTSFAAAPEGCTIAAGGRSVTCEDTDAVLPAVEYEPGATDPDDGTVAGLEGRFAVEVADGAPAPAVLAGGVFTAAALGEAPAATTLSAQARQAGAVANLPEGISVANPEHFEDADPSDNRADFKVHVATPNSGGNGGGGPILPVTGPEAGVPGGIGGAALLLGGALYFVARRRRVVLVAPGDERPTA